MIAMIILQICCFILVALTFCGTWQKIWWFSILDFFRLQYALAALLLFCISALYGAYVVSLICLGIIGYNLHRIRHFLPRLPDFKAPDFSNRQVLSINAYDKNTEPEKLKKVIKNGTI